MKAALQPLVQDLEAQGIRFAWGQRGPSLAGDLGKLTPDYRDALRPHAEELKALVLWRQLQDQAEAKFGHAAARLYPFQAPVSDAFWEAPVVRTPIGRAHLWQMMPDRCRVVKAGEVKEWRTRVAEQGKCSFDGRAHEVALSEVWPPKKPPSAEVLEAWSVTESSSVLATDLPSTESGGAAS